jgi:hypothetical protein
VFFIVPETKSDSATEPKREPREPRALSTEYHKARKQLMLWAAILFIWELVGIDLEKAKEAGGNFGAIVGAIKSPQAVPWALLILVIYFGFKLRIEWRQSNQNRRSVSEAKQDYYSAFVIAGAACLLYFGQTISRLQFADLLQGSGKTQSLVVAAVSSFLFATAIGAAALGVAKRVKVPKDVIPGIIISFIVSLTLPIVTLRDYRNWTFVLMGSIIGLGVPLSVFLRVWQKSPNSRNASEGQ